MPLAPYAPPIFTQMEKVYYYEDRSKPPIMCEIDDIQLDGTVEVMDLSDGRMIRTRIGNLAKVPVEPTSPSPRFSPHSPSPRFSPQSPEMPEKASIFDVEEEKTDEEKEEEKDKDKNDGEKKIVINIKPE
jgi:hypothetical protein